MRSFRDRSRTDMQAAEIENTAERNPSRLSPVCIGIMRETIDFLRKSAEELRDLAGSAPDISDHLRRLAEELDATAIDLERRGNAPRR